MKPKIYLAVLLAFGLLVANGCTGLTRRTEGPAKAPGILEPSGVPKFSDIPVPAGFRPVPLQSYSFESSNVRVGVLRYQGKADVEQVVAFYKEQMPMYNWNLLNVIEYGNRLMNFDRESESCIVDISAKGKTVNLTVSLGPKSQIRKKPDRPLK